MPLAKTNQSTYGVAATTVALRSQCRAIHCGVTGDYYLLRVTPTGNAWILYKALTAGVTYSYACLAVSTTADGLTPCSAGAINFEY